MLFSDRVQETTSTAGTGSVTLAGARAGFQTFNAAFGVTAAATFYYDIVSIDANNDPTGQWEIGRGHLSASTTLVRDSLVSSSTGSAIDFAAGTKNVFATLPAEFLNPSGAQAILSSNKTSQNYTTITPISWDAVAFDTDTYWTGTSPTRLTVPIAGKYVFSAGGKTANVATTDSVRFFVQINGSTSVQGVAFQAVADISTIPAVSLITAPVVLSAGQYAELCIQTSADTSIDLVTNHTWFSVERKSVG